MPARYFKFIYIIILVIALSGCSNRNYEVSHINGITIISNYSAAMPEMKIELSENLSLQYGAIDSLQFANITDICIDKNSDIYLFDYSGYKIHKIDRNGKYLFNFGHAGQGPYEFYGLCNMAVTDGNIIINAQNMRKAVFFDKSGKGVKELYFKNIENAPGFIFAENNLISSFTNGRMNKAGSVYSIQKIELFDLNLNKLNNLYQSEVKVDKGSVQDVPDIPCIALSADKRIYRAEVSKNNYEISVFDNDKKIMNIEKSCRRINYSTEEIAKLKKTNDQIEFRFDIEKSKNIIQSISVDDQNYLWVKPSLEGKDNKRIYDLFQNGIFLNRIFLDIAPEYDLTFINNIQILAVNPDKALLKIFNYKFTNK